MYELSIGTISEGTLRPQDLLTALASALDVAINTPGVPRDDSERNLICEARALAERIENADDAEDIHVIYDGASEVIAELTDYLQAFAPPYTYVGTAEGDGALIGVWPDWDAIESAEHDGDILRCSEIPDCNTATSYDALLVVSDHGNASLYVTSEDGYRWRNVWSVV